MHLRIILILAIVFISFFANSSRVIQIDKEIKYVALKTGGNYLVVLNPNYLAKKEGLNYAYYLDYHESNIEFICKQMNSSVVFFAEKNIHEMAARYIQEGQVQLVPSEKAIDFVVCKK